MHHWMYWIIQFWTSSTTCSLRSYLQRLFYTSCGSCLDRAVVLELLREPPPDLLLMSVALPDQPEQNITVPDTELEDSQNAELVLSVPSEVTPDSAQSGTDLKPPIHALQRGWAAQKRIKKVHVETLERVYRRSTRPTVLNQVVVRSCDLD